MSDEDPPQLRPPRTPAELAGATPLDPDRFRNDAPPVVRRARTTPRGRPAGRQRPSGGLRGWLVAAALLLVLGVGLVAFAVLGEGGVEVARGGEHELTNVTPLLSARRVPELLARPVAARNLRGAVAPVLDAAPPDTCLQVVHNASTLEARLTEVPLVPASNLKLLTAAAALELLGPDTRLSTRFSTDGAPTDGTVVKGNLYVTGGGDPLISSDAYLAQLPNGEPPSTDVAAVADQIAATGIREVTGSVVADDSRYDAERARPSWPTRYLGQGQVGPLSALMVDDGWRVGVGVSDDPALHAATVLTELLEDRGVTISGPPRTGAAPEGAPVLTEVPSLSIAELVDQGLRFSDNTTMELLVKEVGVATAGEGTSEAGLDAIRSWAEQAGLPTEGMVLADGSGLSEDNRLSCALLAELLVREGPAGTVADGLARPGEPGTLRDRLLAQDLRDRVRAKTGTLRPVTALSGWLLTRPEADLGFAFVINTPDRQVGDADLALQSRLLQAMLDYPSAPPLPELSPAAPAAVP